MPRMAKLDCVHPGNLKPKHCIAGRSGRLAAFGACGHEPPRVQPAVSLALAELEKGLGLKLFERTPRGVVPNSYGDA